MSTDLNQLDLDRVAMIFHYDKLFANSRPDLYTVYHRLAKINAHVCSAMKLFEFIFFKDFSDFFI